MRRVSYRSNYSLRSIKDGSAQAPLRYSGVRPISALRLWISEGFTQAESEFVRGGIPRPIGNSPESLSQAILVGIILVGRLGACCIHMARSVSRRARVRRAQSIYISVCIYIICIYIYIYTCMYEKERERESERERERPGPLTPTVSHRGMLSYSIV